MAWLSASALAATPMVSAGNEYAIALKTDGTLSAWGSNDLGQLGNGQAARRVTPAKVDGIDHVVAVVTGLASALALRDDGTVWAWGNNSNGELGDGTTQSKSHPVLVTGLVGQVKSVATTYAHALAATTDGKTWAWGHGLDGQLGNGSFTSSRTAIKVSGLPLTVDKVATGAWHSLALDTDGTVWAWGNNSRGQLGDGTTNSHSTPARVSTLSNIVAISTKTHRNLALDTSGRVWAWGHGGWGALGSGDYSDRTTPFVVTGLPKITAIGTANRVSLAIGTDGSVWMWGDNEAGQFGDTRYARQPLPVSVSTLAGLSGFTFGESHTVARGLNGALKAWGENSYGQLGVGDTNDRSVPTLVTAPPQFTQVSAGADHTMAIAGDGSVWAWGSNGNGELGDGTANVSNLPIDVQGPGNTVAVAAGDFHVLALSGNGDVWAWGPNGNGQLGDGSRRDSALPQRIAALPAISGIAAGNSFSLALEQNGNVWSWGSNGYGQLGIGLIGGAQLTPMVLTTISAVSQLSAQNTHVLAVRQDGSVWAWGSNRFGELGDGTTTDRSTPTKVAGQFNQVISVAAGGFHSLALDRSGNVWAWGANYFGQLGDGTSTDRYAPVRVLGLSDVAAIAAGNNFSYAITRDGRLRAWGRNVEGQLGTGSTDWYTSYARPIEGLAGFQGIAGGIGFAIALRSDGTVWTWGRNFEGQLGDATFAQHTTPLLTLNATASGPLDLNPLVAKNIPRNKIPPFFATTNRFGDLSKFSVTTRTKFNAADVGKSGAVFITAIVPSGTLVPAQSSLRSPGTFGVTASRAYSAALSAVMAANSFTLIQLTSTGWQPVVNSQLIPYATGVLGDQLAAQTILNNADTANLAGAQFCLGYGTSADQMVAAGALRTVASIPDPNATSAGTASCSVQLADIRSYIPAANARAGYAGYLRVINTGSMATPVSVAVIDGATGVVGASGQLTTSLPAGAAVTFSAQQVETALGAPLPAADRSRIRVSALATTIEVQSFMSNPAKVITQVSDALTADTGYAVRSYVPAANAPAGYTSFIRVINVGTTASPIQATLIDDTTGATGASGQLIASLPAGAAITFTAQQIETALGVSLNASSRPRISISAVSVPLEVQSFMANPDGTVTQIGGAQSGTSVAVRSFLPAANASSGYTGFIRVINTGTTTTPVSVSLLDGGTGQAGASAQLVASLPAGAAKTFSAQQVETALGLTLAASARPRILVSASASIDVQSFMSNPGGTVTQLSGAQSGSSADVRTYIPAANASAGYASLIRVINTGTTTTPVSVAVIDGTTGAVGTAGQLTASLPAGAAITFTAQQVETALGQALPAGDRSRIRVTATASTLDVQSFMSNPGGVITETVDFQ
jgi:alpha-tubulin suppressor-like RCC1 family protein